MIDWQYHFRIERESDERICEIRNYRKRKSACVCALIRAQPSSSPNIAFIAHYFRHIIECMIFKFLFSQFFFRRLRWPIRWRINIMRISHANATDMRLRKLKFNLGNIILFMFSICECTVRECERWKKCGKRRPTKKNIIFYLMIYACAI